MFSVPWFTVCVIALCLLTFSLDLFSWLAYERQAADQEWRFVTASLAHYNVTHLLTNMLALGCLGMIFERDWGAGRFAILVLAASLGCTLCVHLFVPDCARFAGISGINYALITFLLGRYLLQRPITFGLCAVLLYLYQSVLVTGEPMQGLTPVPVWQAHLCASLIGLSFRYITDGLRHIATQPEPILPGSHPTEKDTQPCA